MAYQITANENGIERIDHPAGDFKAAFGPSQFFGRDSIKEILDRMDLKESETTINGSRVKVFHNDRVALTMSKDPWVDYENERAKERKEPVYRSKWGGRVNPLRPARSGSMRLIGDQSAVMTLRNLVDWRTFNDAKKLNSWEF